MKTAQEWQKELNLDGVPDAEMLALLNEVSGMGDAPVPASGSPAAQMVPELDVEGLEQHIEECIPLKRLARRWEPCAAQSTWGCGRWGGVWACKLPPW